MVAVEQRTSKSRFFDKHLDVALNDAIPQGYMTAEEWRGRCKKNISEIFRKHEQGVLQ